MGLLSKIFGGGKANRNDDGKTDADVPGPADIVYLSTEDEQMNWAIEKANLTLWYFEESLKEPHPEQQYFSVKIKIANETNIEHVWLEDPEFDTEGNLFGTVGNAPAHVTGVRLGDKVGVYRSVISDWMIIESGRLIGGYTIRAIRDNIPEEGHAAFDESVGLYIDEGADHFKADFDTPEGAILTLEQAFSAKNLDRVLACKDFRAEAALMISKLNFKPDQELIDTTAETLEASFLQYLEENGMPDFSDKTSAFTHREKLDDRYWIITEVCLYSNGARSVERLSTFRSDSGWRVLGVVH